MKRTLLLALTVAFAVVSCSRTYEAHPVSDETPIGFGAWNNTLTRARAPEATAFDSGESFDVFGYKVLAAGNATVFSGDEVTLSGTTWDYSPHRFWDNSATSYVFYAVSPHGIIPATPDHTQDGKFTSSTVTFATTYASTNDILVAQEETVSRPASGVYASTAVPMKFKHVTALLDIKARKSNSLHDSQVTINSVSLNNVLSQGTFTVASYDGTSHEPQVALDNWTAGTTTASYTNASGATSVTLSGITDLAEWTLSASNQTTGTTLIDHLVVMPQTLTASGQQLVINYTITTGTETSVHEATIDMVSFDKSDDKTNGTEVISAWEPNTHYLYYVTIDANAITFSASINAWGSTTQSGYYYLMD